SQRGPRGAECAELAPCAEGDQFRHRKRVLAVDRRQLWQIGQPLPRRTIHDPAGEPFHARDRREERALAGPVRPNYGGQAARSELSAHGLQCYSPPIAHRYVAQPDTAVSKIMPLPICSDTQVEGPRGRPRTAGEGKVVKSREVSHSRGKFTIASQDEEREWEEQT